MKKEFSVIVPTLNRHNYLVDTTEMLLNQKFDGEFEIIIVDQSDKEDQEYIIAYKTNRKVHYYYVQEFRGLPEARNYGCIKSQYSNLIFLDDDIIIREDLLEQHYKHLKDDQIGIVAGGATEKNRKNYNVKHPGSFDAFIAQGYRGFHQNLNGFVSHAPGGNFSVKKQLYIAAGGTDENFNCGSALGEETDTCLRIKDLGYKIYYNYDAHILHLAAPSGGCRVEDVERFVFALVHNRTILIHRFCRFYHKPSAYLYTIHILLSYCRKFKRSFLKELFHGIVSGYHDYKKGIKCTYLKI